MKRLLIPLLWLLAIQLHAAEVISGEIVGITDGDTVKLLAADKQQIKIRLAEIDTPEKNSPTAAGPSRRWLIWFSVSR